MYTDMTANSELLGTTTPDVPSANGRASNSANNTSASNSANNTNHSRGSSFPTQLLPLVPEESPFVWTIINNALAVSGCLLILDVCYTNWWDDGADAAEEQPFATAFFLIWEFAVCFFWMTETALSASYQHWYLQQTPLAWYTKLELVIAAYFMISTFRMLWEWDLLEYDKNAIWDIALDTSFYLYLAVRSCRRVNHEQEEAAISSEELDERSNQEGSCQGSYQIMANDDNNTTTTIV